MKKKEYNYGDKIREFIFLEELPSRMCGKQKLRIAKFKCHCGSEYITNLSHITSGHTKSCGCLRLRYLQRGGLEKNQYDNTISACLAGMKARCYNPQNAYYHRYGGRGIEICEEWRNSSESFKQWCLSNGWEKGLQLDRINNDGNYEPSNCRWITRKQNCRNKSNNVIIEYKGEIKTLAEWIETLKKHIKR